MTGCKLSGVKKVLCLGAHSDDIEIGHGGTILKLIRECPGIEVFWFVFSGTGERRQEACLSAREFLQGAKVGGIQVADFRESYFPDQWASIKDAFEEVKKQFDPDLIFTHCRSDRHQDHVVISNLAWNTFRNHLILEYEVPKYDGDLGHPNVFVPLDEDLCHAKVGAILRNFPTQASRQWFAGDTFMSMLRIRGIECAAGHAEAFYCRKMVLSG